MLQVKTIKTLISYKHIIDKIKAYSRLSSQLFMSHVPHRKRRRKHRARPRTSRTKRRGRGNLLKVTLSIINSSHKRNNLQKVDVQHVAVL